MQVSFTTESIRGFQNDKNNYDLIEIIVGDNKATLHENTAWRTHLVIEIGLLPRFHWHKSYDDAAKYIGNVFNQYSHRIENVLLAQSNGLPMLVPGVAHGIGQGMELQQVYEIKGNQKYISEVPPVIMEISRIKNVVANAVRSSAMY